MFLKPPGTPAMRSKTVTLCPLGPPPGQFNTPVSTTESPLLTMCGSADSLRRHPAGLTCPLCLGNFGAASPPVGALTSMAAPAHSTELSLAGRIFHLLL